MTSAASTAAAAAAPPALAPAPPAPAAVAIGNTIERPVAPVRIVVVGIARIAAAAGLVAAVAGADILAVVVCGIALLGLEYYPNHYQRRRIRRQQSSVQGQTL